LGDLLLRELVAMSAVGVTQLIEEPGPLFEVRGEQLGEDLVAQMEQLGEERSRLNDRGRTDGRTAIGTG
jgi:hypothetical protein